MIHVLNMDLYGIGENTMSDHIYNYIIGRIDKSRKIMVLVNYESRSNLVTQAQLMKVQFPNINTLRICLLYTSDAADEATIV